MSEMMNAGPKIRVLIVDDIAETRENVRKLLQFENDVEVVADGRSGNEGIKLAVELDPDVIIMDINMPDMDGITATEIIRGKRHHIQVVILSVQGDPNYMRLAMLAGARDFLTKPPMGDDLIDAVRRAGEMAKTERGRPREVGAADTAVLVLEQQERELVWFDLRTRLELYQQSLVRGRLVDEVESLVIGLAHDIRSPINIILSILNTMKPADEQELTAFRRIWRRSVYCKWVADNFLGISLSEKLSKGSCSLKAVVAEVILILENLVHPGIKLVNLVDENVEVYADPGSLRLALLNLVVNSLESIQKTGAILIQHKRQKDEDVILVEDEGALVPSKYTDSLFKLGFTTKRSHTGIGLYVSRRLLRQQGGDLVFVQKPGGDTKKFCITLPLKESEMASDPSPLYIKREIEALDEYINEASQEYTRFTGQSLNLFQQKELSKDFQRLTITFSKNLNNELLLIETTVQDVLKKLPSGSELLKNSLKKIIRNCAYCRLLTNNILALGEGIPPEIEDVSLIDIVEEVLLLVDRKMPPDLYRVEWDVDPIIPTIKADPLQMKQVFMNLIKNALDAMPKGGVLRLKLSGVRNLVVAEVGDTGIGIASEDLPRLFQLGFTTKPKGYGIGLFSIKKIIEKHNGKIDVSSVINRGTTFRIMLPIKMQEQS